MLARIYKHLVAPRIALLAAASAAGRRGLKVFEVKGAGMAPTLEPNDIVWYKPLNGRSVATRPTIVAIRSDLFGNAYVPTRVVAVAGETVELREGALIINGVPTLEPYIDPQRAEQDYSLNHPPVAVPAGQVWLCGDFRDISKDSRHLGPFPESVMVGAVTHSHRPGDHDRARAHRVA